eukprot:CAMPEP_0171788958 /NCGR_PEP_ID=MMETSP0991-20121206/64806_1 /TAXON_ID=483369 /ORGANISM="non described non described, Strain CCMP2098" /LENGTH=133 /DNA_ID=CAMNT_0012398201 /DNA_START=284 /DNA_END=685 /DNA_ORIENTATION=-
MALNMGTSVKWLCARQSCLPTPTHAFHAPAADAAAQQGEGCFTHPSRARFEKQRENLSAWASRLASGSKPFGSTASSARAESISSPGGAGGNPGPSVVAAAEGIDKLERCFCCAPSPPPFSVSALSSFLFVFP